MNDTAISLRLGAWWEANARDLPWRFGRATPWGVLVSEVMSQQTQMSRVVPYWNDWMARWPDARALAAAPKADVITAWGRLGYPRRALRLQECARVVAEEYGDELPRTYDELVARQPHVAPRQGSWGRCRLHGPCIPIRRTHFPAAQRTSIGHVESVGDGIGRGGLHSQDAVMRDLPDCG